METFFLKTTPADTNHHTSNRDLSRPLKLLSAFRIFISSTFCLLYLTDNLITPIGSYNPNAFFAFSVLYLFLGISIALAHRNDNIPFYWKVWASAITDILLLSLLMHTSGGVHSGLGVLIVIPLATTSVILGGRRALSLAALATIVILIEHFYLNMNYPRAENYPFAGLLGITYFASAILFMYVAKWVRESEALATRRGIDLANLAELTEHIIQRMQTGILVIDGQGQIRLINESAAQMLRIDEQHYTGNIKELTPELSQAWQNWVREPGQVSESIQLKPQAMDISPRFARIGESVEAGALIFLQDMAAMAQQAQQLQLASLGRLTASIAHEIRNPLGAISHAGQLLAESENLDNNDRRLTQIIFDHTHRLNTIVENVMSVSRRKPSQVELFNLHDYIEQFVRDYTTGNNLDGSHFSIKISPSTTMVRFDTGHLHQILVNLSQNALHHSRNSDEFPKVRFIGGRIEGDSRPYLDVYDNGPGVPVEALEHIFEPFFTTETTGTGLGLYLSRELAECNQARLTYVKADDAPGYFRIIFQDPRRQID